MDLAEQQGRKFRNLAHRHRRLEVATVDRELMGLK